MTAGRNVRGESPLSSALAGRGSPAATSTDPWMLSSPGGTTSRGGDVPPCVPPGRPHSGGNHGRDGRLQRTVDQRRMAVVMEADPEPIDGPGSQGWLHPHRDWAGPAKVPTMPPRRQSPAFISRRMAAVRSQDTGPERAVRSLVHDSASLYALAQSGAVFSPWEPAQRESHPENMSR